MLSATLPAKALYLQCLCNSSVAFSPAWWGWGWGTQLFSAGKTNLKGRSFKDKRLAVPEGLYLALPTADRREHRAFEHRQK